MTHWDQLKVAEGAVEGVYPSTCDFGEEEVDWSWGILTVIVCWFCFVLLCNDGIVCSCVFN